MCGRCRSATSEPTKIRSPRWRSSMPGQHRGGQAVGADQMDLQLRVEVVGADLGQLAEVGVAGAGDQHLDVAERVNGVGHEGLHRVRIGDVEVEADGFAAVGADLADEVVELLHTAGAERDGKAACGEFDGGGLADAGGGAGDDGGSAVGKGGETGHHGPFSDWTVMGRWAKPRTLLEWTRTELASSTS